MDNLAKKLRDAQKEKRRAIKERQKAELLAHTFYQEGWKDRKRYEDEKRASKAAKELNEHQKKYHQ